MKPYYDEGGIQIFHGDCRDFISRLDFDAVLTDPPYGVSGALNTKTAKSGRGRKNDYTMFTDSVDYVVSVAVPLVEWLMREGIPTIMTPGNRCLTLYPRPASFGAVFQPASVGLQAWGRADAQPIL